MSRLLHTTRRRAYRGLSAHMRGPRRLATHLGETEYSTVEMRCRAVPVGGVRTPPPTRSERGARAQAQALCGNHAAERHSRVINVSDRSSSPRQRLAVVVEELSTILCPDTLAQRSNRCSTETRGLFGSRTHIGFCPSRVDCNRSDALLLP